MIKCNHCGHQQPESNTRCSKCGNRLTASSSSSGSSNTDYVTQAAIDSIMFDSGSSYTDTSSYSSDSCGFDAGGGIDGF